MPAMPSTLAVQSVSHSSAVLPRGSTARANSVGVTMLASMWTWASISPGDRWRPAASITSVPAPLVCEASTPT